jgi:hypothetical protein
MDEGSVHPSDHQLTTHSNHKRQRAMPPVEFEPAIPARIVPHTSALDCVATGTGKYKSLFFLN